jgi:hypothetical protein
MKYAVTCAKARSYSAAASSLKVSSSGIPSSYFLSSDPSVERCRPELLCQSQRDYQRYLGPHYSGRIDITPNVVGGEAVAKCREGNAAASIPVLERLLTNGGFTLPWRG